MSEECLVRLYLTFKNSNCSGLFLKAWFPNCGLLPHLLYYSVKCFLFKRILKGTGKKMHSIF